MNAPTSSAGTEQQPAHAGAAHTPRIAFNRAAFEAALFTPGRTFDGYVMRRNRRSLRVWIMGREWTINARGVWIVGTKQPDGRTFWQFAPTHELPFGYSAMADAGKQLSYDFALARPWPVSQSTRTCAGLK